MRLLVTWAIILIIVMPLAARADYHYASHSGSNTYPYTSWETAADSIQKAINSASAGDTIYVGDGVWEDTPFTLWQYLALIGKGIDSTYIHRSNQTGRVRFITTQSHVLIADLTLDGLNSNINNCGIEPVYEATDFNILNTKFINLDTGILIGGNGPSTITYNQFINTATAIDGSFDACSLLVKNNTIIGSTTNGIGAYLGNWTVINNIFRNNVAPHSTFLFAFGMIRSTDSAYIANNIFYQNLVDIDYHERNHIDLEDRCWLVNNTIVGFDTANYERAIGAGLWADSSMELSNNAISGFRVGVAAYESGISSFYNAFWDCQIIRIGAPFDTMVGNLFQNPMFVDSTDFRLQAYSPLIDAGDPNILDVDGSRSDIGCYGGLGGKSYPYSDLPPRIPDSLSASIVGDSLIIRWRMNTEVDFFRYMVNRDTMPGFTPWAANIVAEPETSLFIDLNWDRLHNYYYRIAAYDGQGNLSRYSQELAVINVGISGEPVQTPSLTYLGLNYPNPFNEKTIISYYLADIGYQPAEVKLYIYDILGHLVRRLVDSDQHPGQYQIVWDGLGEGGEKLSSGIYFCRLIVSGIELQKARKITLIK